MAQDIIFTNDPLSKLQVILKKYHVQKYMLVCDSAFQYLPIQDWFSSLPVPHTVFNDLSPNPLYEDICKGVEIFRRDGCDCLIAVGGGSTIDNAKCIKLFCGMNPNENYLKQAYVSNDVLLIAIPTTSGSGSESTRYAVAYYNEVKQSITNDAIIPAYVILEPSVLETVPLYQKKCTMLDALCQGIESWWSVNSTAESKFYSQTAVQMILESMDAYLENSAQGNRKMMFAANYAGRAINITQTTAAHAMSYRLTSLYHLPHGHAVAICLPHVWQYMLDHIDRCVDSRGADVLHKTLDDLAVRMGAPSAGEAVQRFSSLLHRLELAKQIPYTIEELDILCISVNLSRLKNNPVVLSEEVLRMLYQVILEDQQPGVYPHAKWL